jgi:hypothetical protein
MSDFTIDENGKFSPAAIDKKQGEALSCVTTSASVLHVYVYDAPVGKDRERRSDLLENGTDHFPTGAGARIAAKAPVGVYWLSTRESGGSGDPVDGQVNVGHSGGG